jgi:hypothetical protein
MPQDNDRSMLGRQTRERSVQLVSLLNRQRGVWGRSLRRTQELEPRCPAPRPPELVLARIDEQAVHPCLDAIRVAQLRKLAPGIKQGLLGCILCQRGIAQHSVRNGVQTIGHGARKLRERLVIATLCSLHKVWLHRWSP